MFTVKSSEVWYSGEKILSLAPNEDWVILTKEDWALVYTMHGDIHTKTDSQDIKLKVYFLNKEGLVKEFVRNSYRCGPVLGFIRNYFLLYDLEAKFGLYNLEGDKVQDVKYEPETLLGIDIAMILTSFFIDGFGIPFLLTVFTTLILFYKIHNIVVCDYRVNLNSKWNGS
jgi:hypothetical protein